jgi:hypothetical protein
LRVPGRDPLHRERGDSEDLQRWHDHRHRTVGGAVSANGKSVSLNISGPVKISPTGVAIAHGLGAGPVLLPNGQVTLAYFAGPVDISTGTAVPLGGHLRLDLCAALAP